MYPHFHFFFLCLRLGSISKGKQVEYLIQYVVSDEKDWVTENRVLKFNDANVYIQKVLSAENKRGESFAIIIVSKNIINKSNISFSHSFKAKETRCIGQRQRFRRIYTMERGDTGRSIVVDFFEHTVDIAMSRCTSISHISHWYTEPRTKHDARVKTRWI